MSTTSSASQQYKSRKCNGQYIYCNGECIHCEKATVIFSNKNTTYNGSTIHIVKRQG